MNYLLDTNACIVYLNQANSLIRARMQGLQPNQVYLCSVVKAELWFGAMKSKQLEKTLDKLETFFSVLPSIPFDDVSAAKFGEIRAYLQKQGSPIGPYDMQIAAIALANDLILVTHNTREFCRVPELRVEDWEIS
jgi:tRNA(fMet)-specific endonuclease VapC